MKRQELDVTVTQSVISSNEKITSLRTQDTQDANFHYRHCGMANDPSCTHKPFSRLAEFMMLNKVEVNNG